MKGPANIVWVALRPVSSVTRRWMALVWSACSGVGVQRNQPDAGSITAPSGDPASRL